MTKKKTQTNITESKEVEAPHDKTKQEAKVEQLETTLNNLVKTVNFLSAQVQHLYLRLQLAPLDITQIRPNTDTRTETGMGALVSADKTSFI